MVPASHGLQTFAAAAQLHRHRRSPQLERAQSASLLSLEDQRATERHDGQTIFAAPRKLEVHRQRPGSLQQQHAAIASDSPAVLFLERLRVAPGRGHLAPEFDQRIVSRRGCLQLP